MKNILSTICIALLALFAYQVMSYPLDIENAQQSKKNRDLANYDLPQLAVLKSLDEYSEIVQRPLFSKDRAAAVSVSAINKVTTVNELSHLILVGTASSSDVQIAIVADTKAKQMERLKTGQTYKDWEIAEVSTDHVIFQNEKLEYKLFVTPIKGSQKDKQAKLISQLNKSKAEKSNAANKSYQGWKGADKNSENVSEPQKKLAGKIWNNDQPKQPPKYKPSKETGSAASKSYVSPESKPVKRSPIKIPGNEEEKDAAYYEGVDDGDGASGSASASGETVKREITAEDFYDDEDITEDDLKALEGLGAKIFDD